MIAEDKVKKAWQEYYDYKERHFGGPGNGCDDYRDIPDEVFKKKRELEEKARKLQRSIMNLNILQIMMYLNLE